MPTTPARYLSFAQDLNRQPVTAVLDFSFPAGDAASVRCWHVAELPAGVTRAKVGRMLRPHRHCVVHYRDAACQDQLAVFDVHTYIEAVGRAVLSALPSGAEVEALRLAVAAHLRELTHGRGELAALHRPELEQQLLIQLFYQPLLAAVAPTGGEPWERAAAWRQLRRQTRQVSEAEDAVLEKLAGSDWEKVLQQGQAEPVEEEEEELLEVEVVQECAIARAAEQCDGSFDLDEGYTYPAPPLAGHSGGAHQPLLLQGMSCEQPEIDTATGYEIEDAACFGQAPGLLQPRAPAPALTRPVDVPMTQQLMPPPPAPQQQNQEAGHWPKITKRWADYSSDDEIDFTKPVVAMPNRRRRRGGRGRGHRQAAM